MSKTTFTNVKDMLDYLKKNPEIAMRQNIGKEFEIDCPVCKKRTKAVLVTEKEAICQECKNKIKLNIQVK